MSRLGEWLNELPFVETDRFANVEFAEVNDEEVFFDRERREGFRWCSKLQIYLELMTGSKRERDAASQIREDLLSLEITNRIRPQQEV